MNKVEEHDKPQDTQIVAAIDSTATVKLPTFKQKTGEMTPIKTKEPEAIKESTHTPTRAKADKQTKAIVELEKVEQKKKKAVQKSQPAPSKRVREEAQMLRIRCKQLCVSAFFQGHASLRSLAFTSSIPGEGKSFLARLAAEVTAEDDSIPVTLLECNWENATLSTVFHLPQGPGLADWLRGDCKLSEIRYQVQPNLTVIPSGNSKNNAIGLLRTLQQLGAHDVLTQPNELLIVDLPAITTTPYGQLAASLFDSLILVVRMGVTPESFISEANSMLKDLPVEGVILNQVKSVIPSWLRHIL